MSRRAWCLGGVSVVYCVHSGVVLLAPYLSGQPSAELLLAWCGLRVWTLARVCRVSIRCALACLLRDLMAFPWELKLRRSLWSVHAGVCVCTHVLVFWERGWLLWLLDTLAGEKQCQQSAGKGGLSVSRLGSQRWCCAVYRRWIMLRRRGEKWCPPGSFGWLRFK